MEASKREREPRSWTARVLAPLALIAVLAAVFLIISGSLGGEDEGGESDEPKREQASIEGCEVSDEEAVDNGYYVVSEDDVSGLSGISEATCIPLERLENLNPNLDPQTLQVANCVDLVRDGCKALAE